MTTRTIVTYFGVDFSGAKLAGRNTWVATCDRVAADRLAVTSLSSLEVLAGTAERAPVLAALVELVRQSKRAAWGMDFPFGLPIELFPPRTSWAGQFDFIRSFGDDAYECGLACVRRAQALGGSMHIRRATDVEAKTPFDCYHYRIIYQTFFGMKDVIDPLRKSAATAILPFQYSKRAQAETVVVESCPSSTLKRLGLPHRNYKQPAGGPLTALRKRTRHRILAGLESHCHLDESFRRIVMRNGGGDALDAVLAAVGAFDALCRSDHAAIETHPRYRREGYLYV